MTDDFTTTMETRDIGKTNLNSEFYKEKSLKSKDAIKKFKQPKD